MKAIPFPFQNLENPLACPTDIEPRQPWNARRKIYPVETFDRMLRIAAGLEGVRPGEEPIRDFIGLLPWFREKTNSLCR
jgi:hypothetical protein